MSYRVISEGFWSLTDPHPSPWGDDSRKVSKDHANYAAQLHRLSASSQTPEFLPLNLGLLYSCNGWHPRKRGSFGDVYITMFPYYVSIKQLHHVITLCIILHCFILIPCLRGLDDFGEVSCFCGWCAPCAPEPENTEPSWTYSAMFWGFCHVWFNFARILNCSVFIYSIW